MYREQLNDEGNLVGFEELWRADGMFKLLENEDIHAPSFLAKRSF